MSFFRNREIKIFILLLLGVGALGTAVCFFVAPLAGMICGAVSVVLVALTFLFTRRRYVRISKLSAYLRRINSGDYSLDVRDNTEGELSILKNEIYKVTVMLREQNETLSCEKIKLADALFDISHQLKTPLTSMFVMTDLLCEPFLPDEKRKEFTDRIRIQLERLQWLVSSLLKFSRLDAKVIKFNPQKVPVKVLIEKASEPLMIPIELKNQTLVAKDGGISLCCDESWTVEALLNILKNCVEHTSGNGEIKVTCSENPIFTEIRVEDNGPGIDEKDLPNIFKRFYRGKNSKEDSIGIGLALAAAIVQEQGGSIETKNRPAGGSMFTMRFPK